jgi:hypothetical protein
MKSASIPSLRVDPELHDAAESVLLEGESLSNFVEQSLKLNIERRRAQQEFIARGLASRDEARSSDRYYPAADVAGELKKMLTKARAKARS